MLSSSYDVSVASRTVIIVYLIKHPLTSQLLAGLFFICSQLGSGNMLQESVDENGEMFTMA